MSFVADMVVANVVCGRVSSFPELTNPKISPVSSNFVSNQIKFLQDIFSSKFKVTWHKN